MKNFIIALFLCLGIVFINGVQSNENTVDPSKHRYVGMFRLPFSQIEKQFEDNGGKMHDPLNPYIIIVDIGIVYRKWLDGLYDVPQYVDIKD